MCKSKESMRNERERVLFFIAPSKKSMAHFCFLFFYQKSYVVLKFECPSFLSKLAYSYNPGPLLSLLRWKPMSLSPFLTRKGPLQLILEFTEMRSEVKENRLSKQ